MGVVIHSRVAYMVTRETPGAWEYKGGWYL